MSININPQGVHTAGNNLSNLAESAKAKTEHALDASADTAGAHPGWESSAAVLGCEQEWTKHLTGLIGQIDSTAQKLHDSATTHQQTDEEAARRLNEVLDELSK